MSGLSSKPSEGRALDDNVTIDRRKHKSRKSRPSLLETNVQTADLVPDMPIATFEGPALNPADEYFDIPEQAGIGITNTRQISTVEHVKLLAQHYPLELLDTVLGGIDQEDEALKAIRGWNKMQQNAQDAYRLRDQAQNKVTQMQLELDQANQAKWDAVLEKEQLELEIHGEPDSEEEPELEPEPEPSPKADPPPKLRKKPKEKAKEKDKRSPAFATPPTLTDGIDPPYETWKLRVSDKLQNNADWYHSEADRATNVISWTGGEAAQHLDALRMESPRHFKNEDMVFEVLDSLYQDPDRVRNAREKYGKLKMQPGQPFVKFYSQFLYLANQLKDYSEKTKMDDLERKVTSGLRLALIGSDDPTSLEALKKKLMSADLRLRHIYEDTPKSSSTKDNASTAQAFVKKAMGTKAPRVKPAHPLSDIEKRAFSRISAREQAKGNNNVGCFGCGSHDHLWAECDLNPKGSGKGAAWLNKEIKKEVAIIKLEDQEALDLASYEETREDHGSNASETSESESELAYSKN